MLSDGLAAFKNISGPQAEKIKKDFARIFKNNELEIVIECNKKVVNFLDVTLNLNDGTHKPYHKPDTTLQYIHKESNHPSNIIKQIPLIVEKRLSSLSSNEKIFKEAAPDYEAALNKSGIKHKLSYRQENEAADTRGRRNRKCIWFNPPFNKAVSTNIAKKFLDLIDKHFPRGHKFYKIFNRNNVKVSYSCTQNMKDVISSHNKKILQTTPENEEEDETEMCNCRRSSTCPLDGNCKENNIVYKATIESSAPNYEPKTYIGSCSTSFKARYGNHKQSFESKTYEKQTSLSTELWRIKDAGDVPKVTWCIMKKCRPCTPMSCDLCTSEKWFIAKSEDPNALNKKNEIVSKCLHDKRFMLCELGKN